MSKITVKQAAHWVSEAWGRDIPARRCRLRGNWLFVDDPCENDIDCLYAGLTRFGRLYAPNCEHCGSSGNLWGEPWTAINWEDSPFNPKWDKGILEKLDAEIKEHQEETEH